MTTSPNQGLLRKLPSISDLLAMDTVQGWLAEYPRELVTHCLRDAVDGLRRQILADTGGRCGAMHVTPEYVLAQAHGLLLERTRPHIRGAINATGIILHTGLGRAAWPASVVESMVEELKGYVTLAISKETGERLDRDLQIEYILTELTGAEAATVVNNNAGATLLVLAALAAEREVIVSRGQLIEIGGAFRLPEVMEQGRVRMVEVGTTNRTHLRDYERAITGETAAILRAHPSNFRVVGFTAEVAAEELAGLAHEKGLIFIDDLGAGALVDLARFGLPHEPTVQASLAAGADVVLFSADKLIGASQGGIITGKKEYISRIRKHPLYRALRADKTCLMALERTLMLFRDPELLAREHPLYRMLSTPPEELGARAEELVAAIRRAVPGVTAEVIDGVGYLGSGSLPMEALPTKVVALAAPGVKAAELARRLRQDEACVCARIEQERVLLDVRTMREDEVEKAAGAVGRVI
ncbi:MAG: L-seryl-tRNA(Sec) selenium transferase [Armatimonadota bacterium]